MSPSSPVHGVPSLSRSDRLVLLRGAGRCPAIRNIEQRGESDSEEERRSSKKRKRIVISDSEDDFVPSVAKKDHFVRDSLKVKKRTTPRRSATAGKKSYTPRRKRVEIEDVEDVSPVPPVENWTISTPARPTVLGKREIVFNNNCDQPVVLDTAIDNSSKEEANVKTAETNNVNPEASVPDQHSEIPRDIPTNCDQNKSSANVNDNSPTDLVTKVGDICLPPGFGSDKLAKVLIYVLEEKVRISSSHSERELFRKTIHVLLCGGCKDREKHNKVRCSRCEDRDKRRKREKKDDKNASGGGKTVKEKCDMPPSDIANKKVERTKDGRKSDSQSKKENRIPSSVDLIVKDKKDHATKPQSTSVLKLPDCSKLDQATTNVEDMSLIQKYLDRINEDHDKINRDEVFSDYSDQDGETGLNKELNMAHTSDLIHSDEINTEPMTAIKFALGSSHKNGL